jgi:predicted RNase H-like HicB family nuclease
MRKVMVGEGNTYEEVIADVRLATKFHIETFRKEDLEVEEIVEIFAAELIFC